MTDGVGRARADAKSVAERRPVAAETVLNVGASERGTGDVTLDLLSSVEPDVQGSATALPFADETFDVVEMDQYEPVERDVTVWVLDTASLSGVRSAILQTVHRSLDWTDGVVYRPSVGSSIHFALRKV